MQVLLGAEDYQVTGFGNVADFRLAFQNKIPDVMVLDVMLPDDVCNEIKADEGMQEILILIMSANTSMANTSRQSKADDFIAKPFDINELIKKVHKMLP